MGIKNLWDLPQTLKQLVQEIKILNEHLADLKKMAADILGWEIK